MSLNKLNIANLRKTADQLFPNSADTYKTKKTYFHVLSFIHKNDWQGACHASSALLYVLLKTQGVSASLYVGEVQREQMEFDHSWIEINQQPYDAAISNTLVAGASSGPVFNGIDLEKAIPTSSDYSFSSGNGLGELMLFISGQPLGNYMDGFEEHPKGLWGVASKLAKELGIRFNIGKAKIEFSNDSWLQKATNHSSPE